MDQRKEERNLLVAPLLMSFELTYLERGSTENHTQAFRPSEKT